MLTRRGVFAAAGWVLAGPAGATEPTGPFAAIEHGLGGRVGIAALDTGTGRGVGWRERERFPLCSTFKLIAAGLILSRVDRGEEKLDRHIAYAKSDLVAHSPVTERHADEGMSLAEICRAAITRSDNTAANLMLASFGGPPALTEFARRLGDQVTRLDRTETALNEALPDDPRDTTAPAAMLGLMKALLVEDTLSAASRRLLGEWLLANETGAARIRAAAPSGWDVGDKTGTGERGAAGDVAILRPPGRAPILLAVYLHGSEKPIADLNAAIASSAGIALKELAAG